MGLYQRGALETEANTETYNSTPSKPFSRLFSSILLSLQTGIDVGYFLASDLQFQIDDGSGMKREATVDDLIKTVEELTRIH